MSSQKRIGAGLFLIFLLQLNLQSFAIEPHYPEIGKPCPQFLLTGIENYPVAQKSLKDFKGKPFILDFFTFGCSSCFESFPKINLLKEVYGSGLDILLVGKEEKGIHELYERFKEREELNLPIAYTRNLFSYLGIHYVPFVLWVDAKGIVRAVTTSHEITTQNVDLFLKGQDFYFVDESHKAEMSKDLQYDWEKPLLIHQNGGDDTAFLFRSVLSNWNPKLPQEMPAFVSNTEFKKYAYNKEDRFQATGIWLSHLYQMAYGDTVWALPSSDMEINPICYGQWANEPELLIKDSSQFKFDFSTGKGIYCYSLIVPPGRFGTQDLKRMMQNDLSNYFLYTVSVEDKLLPCWLLEADSSARSLLLSKGGYPKVDEGGRFDVKLNNVPMKALIYHLFTSHQDAPPFIDETGITENIDMQIDGFADDSVENIAGRLKRYGLLLHPGKRMMKVIVIRDRN